MQFQNEILKIRSMCVRGKSPLDVVAVIFCKESRSRGFGQQAFGSKPHSLLYSLLHIVLIPGSVIEWWNVYRLCFSTEGNSVANSHLCMLHWRINVCNLVTFCGFFCSVIVAIYQLLWFNWDWFFLWLLPLICYWRLNGQTSTVQFIIKNQKLWYNLKF